MARARKARRSLAEGGRQAQAGYSSRSLAEKLGLKAGDRVAILEPPPQYLTLLGEVADRVQRLSLRARQLDFIHLFARSRGSLEPRFARAAARLQPAGILWVSWPKQSSPLAGDLSENVVREVGLELGMVDVKVAAIDFDWSGLKFVFRQADRPPDPRTRSKNRRSSSKGGAHA